MFHVQTSCVTAVNRLSWSLKIQTPFMS